MAKLVVMNAMCQCTFGTAPGTLVLTPENKTTGSMVPAATIMDYVPIKNLASFGMCSAPSNPAVAAATAAASGVLTPQPCIPATSAPWTPGCSSVLINNKPALNNTSKCMCNWGGVISITNPGQTSIDIP
ncbi:MAG: DUF4280 domain-containing protein [Phycisphaerales bacterium]